MLDFTNALNIRILLGLMRENFSKTFSVFFLR